MRLLNLLILSIGLSSFVAVAPECGEADQNPTRFTGGYLRFDKAEQYYSDYGVEWAAHWAIDGNRIWLTQRCGMITGVTQSRDAQITSFQGPVGATAWMLTRLIEGGRTAKRPFYQSPLFIVLSLPNSQLEYALSDNFLVGFRNNTEYLFARGHKGERGIAFTPSLTLAFWKYTFGAETSDAIGAQVQVGPTYFLNFEGSNRDIGWTAGVAVFFHFVDH